MKPFHGVTLLFGAFLVAVAMTCFGPWYNTQTVIGFHSLSKVFFLLLSAGAGFWIFGKHSQSDSQRWPWLVLAVGILSYSVGQSVLCVHQVFLHVRMPFPSWGDLFFAISYFFIVGAFVSFGILAQRSGLPLGKPMVFWSPAGIVILLCIAGAYPLLAPVLQTQDPWMNTFLNLYYPLAGFIALAPCAVMLRVGWEFRGGRLLMVWAPITLGFASVFVSDVLFSYLTSVGVKGIDPLMDFLYLCGYVLIAWGMITQASLLKR